MAGPLGLNCILSFPYISKYDTAKLLLLTHLKGSSREDLKENERLIILTKRS